jgi:hydroxyacylglutathione hydrolase
MSIPLEDSFADVLGKAALGLNLGASEIAERSGLSQSAVEALLGGAFDAEAAAAVARPLGLDPVRVVALGSNSCPVPEIEPPEGLLMFHTAFGDMAVNSYLVWDLATKDAALFDTGADADPALEALRDHGLTLRDIFLTHAHGDHVIELDRLKEKTGALAWIGENEPLAGAASFAAGRPFSIGGLSVETRSTPGHSAGATTYLIGGLSKPVAIVGDAIFARSIGGPRVSFAEAIATIRRHILTLPDETILCPGHGPLTTVGNEKLHNPFCSKS